mmetsp:Transcript_10748/g.25610  ORF Transcript_10748/g.25610 Transcript_10748/m.25610 type:complete len:228 (+) Transcript_10748:174-857(+)
MCSSLFTSIEIGPTFSVVTVPPSSVFGSTFSCPSAASTVSLLAGGTGAATSDSCSVVSGLSGDDFSSFVLVTLPYPIGFHESVVSSHSSFNTSRMIFFFSGVLYGGKKLGWKKCVIFSRSVNNQIPLWYDDGDLSVSCVGASSVDSVEPVGPDSFAPSSGNNDTSRFVLAVAIAEGAVVAAGSSSSSPSSFFSSSFSVSSADFFVGSISTSISNGFPSIARGIVLSG